MEPTGADGRSAALDTSSSHGRPVPAATIHDTFHHTARRHPERIAVRSADRAATYRELAEDARRTAARLAAHGVGPGDIVPVVARRSVDLPAVLLGILATGAAYGMLDVRWPPGRLHRLLGPMRAPLVLADQAGAAGVGSSGLPVLRVEEMRHSQDAPDAPEPLPSVSPRACSTVFWTSGSTGAPKAVLSTHQATVRLFAPPGFDGHGDAPVVVHAAAVAWDAFTLEMWGALLTGGTLLVHPGDLLLPHELRSYISEFGADQLFLTPSLADVLVAGDIDCLAGLRHLMLGGDKPTPATCEKLLASYPELQLVNGYGPVESCVFATTHRITPADARSGRPVPAGRAVPGTGVHVLADGRVLPPGQVGEVALSGDGLALGYLDEPALTEAAFTTVTVDGAPLRVYLTGDQGRIDADGVLHLAGRKDAQLKIAGHRIEPAEIEAAALSLGSARAVALPLPDPAGNPRLVLFAEPPEPGAGATGATGATGADEADEADEAGLRSRLRQVLPAYLVPARVHLVPRMPLLDNTKIDKRALAREFGYLV